jgi:DNA-3-methyladenine glycosylase
MTKIISQKFYQQPTLVVAKKLLGKYLVRKIGRQKIIGQIVETEAYCGPHDLASHASRGLTERNKVMFGPAGHWYVYLIYGMYYCLNVVTERNNYPAAVLIRSVRPISGPTNKMKVDGPGKLCRAFKIDKSLNQKSACQQKTKLWIEDHQIKVGAIKKAKRVGVAYAGQYQNKLWRFYLIAN